MWGLPVGIFWRKVSSGSNPYGHGSSCHPWQHPPVANVLFAPPCLSTLFEKISPPPTNIFGRTFHPPWAFVGFTATLRYEPCTQFINVSQKMLHIYWQFSAMSHAIHKIVSKRRCQSYFISRHSPHHGISKDSDLCASAHRCLHYAYAWLIARVTFKLL